MVTRIEMLLRHANDYTSAMGNTNGDFPTSLLNIVIPYHNSSSTIEEVVLKCLASIKFASDRAPELKAEITIVDDGSDEPLPLWIAIDPRIRVAKHIINLGRAAARNTGLSSIASTFTMFVDADVVLYPEAVFEHYIVHAKQRLLGKLALTANLFNFVEVNNYGAVGPDAFDVCNDFRFFCTYESHWIGSEEDYVYVGQKFETLAETEYWAKWPVSGYYGPWTLPNMVLGGCFMVPTAPSMALQGQDLRFREYGFTETTLVTKLITHAGCYVIPMSSRFCVHLDADTKEERALKNEMFRKAHHQFYQRYLVETPPKEEWFGLSDAIDLYRNFGAASDLSMAATSTFKVAKS